jgi:hypothetical protein
MADATMIPVPRCGRLQLAILAAITLVGSLNRIMLAAERPLWFDEALSVYNSQVTSYADLLRWKGEDRDQPPLSFILMKASGAVLGAWDPWAVHLVPVIAGVLCIPSVFFLGKALGSPSLGLWASALAAFDPVLVALSATARMYSLLCLGVILTLVFTVMTIRTGFSLKYCVALGLTLGASLWTSLLGWVPCCTAALALALSLTQFYFSQPPRPSFARACWDIATVFVIGGLVGFPSIRDTLTQRLGQTSSPNPTSFGQIMFEIYRGLGHLEPLSHVWILVFVAACAGVLWLWLRQGAVVIPLVALGLFSFVFAVLLRQRHPFFAARYLTPLLPVVWIGLATFPAFVAPQKAALAFQALLCALLVFHTLYWVDLMTTWRTHYEFIVSQEVALFRDKIAPGDRVVFSRQNCLVFGRYYGLPVDTDLENQLLAHRSVSPAKSKELRSSSNATWLVAARVKSDEHVDRSQECLERLARAYGVAVNTKEVRKHFRKLHFIVVRVKRDGIEYSSRDLTRARSARHDLP